jgi:hypothetical protein
MVGISGVHKNAATVVAHNFGIRKVSLARHEAVFEPIPKSDVAAAHFGAQRKREFTGFLVLSKDRLKVRKECTQKRKDVMFANCFTDPRQCWSKVEMSCKP